MKKISIFLMLVVATSITLSSCNKTGSSKLESKTDTISYALGTMQGARILENLQKDTVGPNFEAFIEGFKKAMGEKEDSATLYYSFGMQIASQLKMEANEGFMGDSTMKLSADIIKDAFIAAIKKNKDSKITADEATTLIQALVQKKQAEQAEKQFGAVKSAGEKFLAENKSKAGVITLASGLQYKVIKEGKGPKPTASDKVKVHYTGTLIDGKVFDSSVQRNEPAVFPVGGVIKGWTEALQLMPVGSKWQVFIPQELAYGGQSQDPIPPYSALVFDVELISIEK